MPQPQGQSIQIRINEILQTREFVCLSPRLFADYGPTVVRNFSIHSRDDTSAGSGNGIWRGHFALPTMDVGPAAFGGTFPSMPRATLAVASIGLPPRIIEIEDPKTRPSLQ